MSYTKTDPEVDKKLPPNPDTTVRSTAAYPFIFGTNGPNGEQNIASQFADIQLAFAQLTDINSGYHIKENTKDKKNAIHQLKNAHEFTYGSGGRSGHNDGNQHYSTKGQRHEVTKGSRGMQTGKDTHEGNGGSKISGTGGDGRFEHEANGHRYIITKGDWVSSHDGNTHNTQYGDAVDSTLGNKYQIVKNEYGIYVDDGNLDLMTATGKIQISATSNLNITSNASIILTVGQASITMLPDRIVLAVGPPGAKMGVQITSANVVTTANTYIGKNSPDDISTEEDSTPYVGPTPPTFFI